MSDNDAGWKAALDEARQGAAEDGVPVGACLVDKNGMILGRGRNCRMQKGSAILHGVMMTLHQGETAAIENAGRLPPSAYQGSTMYTTLSPCPMCTGACILYGVSRVVMGENNTYVGDEEHLKQRGIEIVNLRNAESEQLMGDFIRKHPEEWYEDIGKNKQSL